MGWKIRKELERWPEFRRTHLRRFFNAVRHPTRGDVTHSFVNLLKEACETFPYQMGHILAYGIIVGTLAAIVHVFMVTH